jgi:hypothetical protein
MSRWSVLLTLDDQQIETFRADSDRWVRPP